VEGLRWEVYYSVVVQRNAFEEVNSLLPLCGKQKLSNLKGGRSLNYRHDGKQGLF
jgi:hypothetical protein